MLNDRRHCLRGRADGAGCLRMAAWPGDPPLGREKLPLLANGGLSRAVFITLLLDVVMRSPVRSDGGDSANMSSRDGEALREPRVTPLPNLKGGARLPGAGLETPSKVEWALVRTREGRTKLGRLFLEGNTSGQRKAE